MDDAENAAAALTIIQGWDWVERGFDGLDTGWKWLPLHDVVNSLAFGGHADPAGAFLRLLADDALIAWGDYKWLAFRAGEHFGGEGNGEIPAARWLPIVNADPFDVLDLRRLGLSKQVAADWNWRHNTLTMAAVSGDPAKWWESKYTEEYFSAWDIEVYCPSAETGVTASDNPSSAENDDGQPNEPSVPTIGHKRGRSPTYDWEDALAHVAAIANTPDGLETGPGAQAAIERLIADHFAQTRDDGRVPCESEVRKRASRVMKAIAALKPSLSNVA